MSEMIAKRYARAVFDLAREQSIVSEVVREMAAFAEAYETSRDFREVDHLPTLRDAERRAVVEALGSRIGASQLSIRTVSMLAERQRLAILPDLVRVLEAMGDEHLGILRGSVTSAVRLDEDYRSALKRKIEEATGKKVILSFDENPSLIAGIVTQIGDRVIDGSVRGRINQLAESLRQA